MNLLIYGLAAVLAGAFAIRAPLDARRDPQIRAFSVLAGLIGLAYFGFTIYLIPGLGAFKYLHGGAGALLPWAFLQLVERLLPTAEPRPNRRPQVETNTLGGRIETLSESPPRPPPEAEGSAGRPAAGDPADHEPAEARPELSQGRTLENRRLGTSGLAMAGFFVVADLAFARNMPRASWPEVLLGLYVLGAFCVPLWRLWERYRSTSRRVERARVGYIFSFAAFAVGFSMLEALVRSIIAHPATDGLGYTARPVVLQGPVPPIGALFASLFIFAAWQVASARRVLDPSAIFIRLAAVAIAGSALVGLNALSISGLAQAYPVHSVFQVFMVSGLFLLAYEPVGGWLQATMERVLFRRSDELQRVLRDLDDAVPRALTPEGAAEEVVARLTGSGCVGAAAVYLWDEGRRSYHMVASGGFRDQAPLRRVAAHLLVGRGAWGATVPTVPTAWVRSDLERHVGPEAELADERLRLLDAVQADVVLPLLAGETVLGWLALRDAEGANGLSDADVARLSQSAGLISRVVENLHGFARLKEMHRLAALGTMAAGLAHEIRNPLAAIKGATQFLQATDDPAEAEMKRVIVDEVDRLNVVVSQFLDYSRPLQLHTEPLDLNALVSQVAGLFRAQGLADGVTVVEELAAELPPLPADAAKLKQVLLNLGQNGLLAMEEGGVLTLRTRKGRLRDSRGTPAVLIVVEDRGCGVPPEDLDKLFVPFFTTRAAGTGLGLAISQRLIEAHGGQIDVSSTPGRGSTFTVRLPISGLD